MIVHILPVGTKVRPIVRALMSVLLLWLVHAVPAAPAGDILFENSRLQLVLGTNASWQSVFDKRAGIERLALASQIPFVAATVDRKALSAQAAVHEGDRVRVTLAGGHTELVYRVDSADEWIAFQLERVTGPRPSQSTLVRLPVKSMAHFGPRLNGVWDPQGGIVLSALNLQTQAASTRGGDHVELAVTTQDGPGPKLEGAGAALIVGTPAELRASLRHLAAAYDLPRNESPAGPAKDLPEARESYWFLSFGEKDADRVIECCEQSGIRQVLLMSGAWCQDVGHYTFRTNLYPDGIASLHRTVARLHARDIRVGMHAFASKISKTDAYVAPAPDRRFWVDMSVRLAGDIESTNTTIRAAGELSQWPGSPVGKQQLWEGGVTKHQEVVIDDEIIRYEQIGPEGQWDTFLGCARGAWNTRAATHRAGAECRHHGVDGCINGYIVDQETSLLDETTARLAMIFNTCDFDMVYFDGGEDVPRTRFTYYVSKFQATAMRQFHRRPLIHMGTIMTHNLWHSFTRTATVDTFLNTLHGRLIAGAKIDRWPTVRDHIDTSVRHLRTAEDDLLPGELGWFGIWPKGRDTDGLQLDEIEYLMTKSLGHDAPISLETSFGQMAAHPLTPGILEIVGVYERLRRSGRVPIAARAALGELGRDFVLVPPDPPATGQLPGFVAAKPSGEVAGGRELRGMIGPHGRDTVVTLWHYLGQEGTLALEADNLSATDIHGHPVQLGSNGERRGVPLGCRRTTLRFRETTPQTAQAVLSRARFQPAKTAGAKANPK